MTFWSGSGSGDPYLWLMDPAPDLDPTPDPTPFFSDFKGWKKIIFSYFLIQLTPQAHYLQTKFNFFPTFFVKILFCKHYFSPLNIFMRKGKDTDPEPHPYIWLLIWILIQEAKKHADLTARSGSPTLLYIQCILKDFHLWGCPRHRCDLPGSARPQGVRPWARSQSRESVPAGAPALPPVLSGCSRQPCSDLGPTCNKQC
jgi:hypothetical protein